jgi:hypothetical protein
MADWGRLFLGYFLLAKQKKVTSCRATPGNRNYLYRMRNKAFIPSLTYLLLGKMMGYRPIAINTPEAIAKTDMTVPNPLKPKLTIGSSPVKISQMDNNNIPIFFVNFIIRLP